MTTRFAKRMEVLKASEIREILKVTQRPEVISFAGGLPAPELFPVKTLAAATQKVLEEEGMRALQYSTTEGHAPLRRKIAERMKTTWDAHVAPEQILVTTGSQQGLDLTGKLLLDEGDVVLCESPTYLGAISALNASGRAGSRCRPTTTGWTPYALEEAPRRAPDAKAIYVVPNFQNPSGRTWSLERRRRFMEIVERHDVPVVEDNPYGELRFEGAPIAVPEVARPEGARHRARHLLEGLLPGPAHRLDRRRGPVLREARHPQAGGRPAHLDARPAPGEPLPRGVRPRRRHRADPPRLPRAARRHGGRARRRDARPGSASPAPRAGSSSG